MLLSTLLIDVNDGGRILIECQIIIPVKFDLFMSGLSVGNNDTLNVFILKIGSKESIIVFPIHMDHNLVSVPTRCNPEYFVQRDFTFDPIGHYRFWRCNINDIFISYGKGSLLPLIYMIDLSDS